MDSVYNPLDKKNLGISVRDALLSQPVNPMPPGRFRGAGIYAIYYTGSFKAYLPVSEQNRGEKFACPIDVGKAVPGGSRKGGIIRDPEGSAAIANRIKHHSDSIAAARNLKLEDFHFRYLVVDDIWIPLGEAYMIDAFQPVWNKIVEGFGIKTPGKRRKDQYTSIWDTLHPGRHFVEKLGLPPNPKNADAIRKEVERYLAMPREDKARLPVKDFGDDDAVQDED